nr:hypothetical protein [Tanacetum cinerariifolium]
MDVGIEQWDNNDVNCCIDTIADVNVNAPAGQAPTKAPPVHTIVDVNVNAPAGQAPTKAPPVRTDDQILPRIRWVPIGKSNCYLDLDKSQSNPIYKIAVCQLDEQWFDLTKDTLREALQITPVNNNQAFISPPSSDALINFVNKLGYPKLVRNLSNVITNDMFQPWRALTTIINLCLIGKTYGFERPRAPMMQILWGIRTHKFHPRPDSPLHLPNEGTKREVFGIPIPGSLITEDIQEASYYQEYLEKVAKHQRYQAGETGSDPDSPTLKPTKPARKPKSTAPKAPPRPSVSKPVTSTQPEPKSAPAKTQGKKHKPTTDISDKPSKATKSKHGFVSKQHKPISTQKSVDKSVAEDIPAKEPHSSGNLSSRNINRSRDNKEESQEVVPGADVGGQGEGQAGPDPGAQAEGQAGPDHGAQDEEEPASSSGTLSSLQHLSKDLSFGDLFFSDKPSEADNDKAIAETEVELMVSITIQQDMSSIPLMASPFIDLTSRPESPKAIQAPLRNSFRDLPEADMKEILHQRMWETDSYKYHEDHMQLYEALEKSMNLNHSEELVKDLAEAHKKKKKRRESPKTPPGSPPHQPPLLLH